MEDCIYPEEVKQDFQQRIMNIEKNKTEKNICGCCKIREVPTEPVNGVLLTRLCKICYLNAEQELENEHKVHRDGRGI